MPHADARTLISLFCHTDGTPIMATLGARLMGIRIGVLSAALAAGPYFPILSRMYTPEFHAWKAVFETWALGKVMAPILEYHIIGWRDPILDATGC